MESIGKRFLRKPETLAKQSNVGTCSYEARWSQRLLVDPVLMLPAGDIRLGRRLKFRSVYPTSSCSYFFVRSLHAAHGITASLDSMPLER